jgi:hypothetical protein
MNEVTLAALIAWILTNGGAGWFTWFLMSKIKWFAGMDADYKRYWSLGIAAVVAGAAWGLGMLMNYYPVPTDWRSGLEMAFATIGVAIVSSQLIHGAVDLRKRAEMDGRR